MSPLPLRIIPLGGLGEVGKNMLCVEYGDDIVVIDAGLMFPKADMHGVDLVLPDTSYLIENADRVRAVLITHGHEDHTGALPYLLRNLDVPVYAPPLAHDLIEVKLRDRAGMERYDLREADAGDRLQFGAIEAEYFRVCHSIPDACGIALRTPCGVGRTHGRLQDRPHSRGRTPHRSATPRGAQQGGSPPAPVRLDIR